MKTLTLGVPTGGKVIVTGRQPPRNRNQQDCFAGYKTRWIVDMARFIRSIPRPVSMSAVRVEAGKQGKGAPLSPNWYGASMRAAGLTLAGYRKSPLESRRGGVEAVWK